MEVGNGTGRHKVEQKNKNIEKIKDWFERNPGSTKKECSIALGISYPTVITHVKTLLSESKK